MLVYSKGSVYDFSDGTIEPVTKEYLLKALQLGVRIDGVRLENGNLVEYPYWVNNRLKLQAVTGIVFDDTAILLTVRGNGYNPAFNLDLYLPLPLLNSNGRRYNLILDNCNARLRFTVANDFVGYSPQIIFNGNSTLDVSLLPENVADMYIMDALSITGVKCDYDTLLQVSCSHIVDSRLQAGSERYSNLLRHYAKNTIGKFDADSRVNIWVYAMYMSDVIASIEERIQRSSRIAIMDRARLVGKDTISSLRTERVVTSVAYDDWVALARTIDFIYLFGMGHSEVIDRFFDKFIKKADLGDIDLQA